MDGHHGVGAPPAHRGDAPPSTRQGLNDSTRTDMLGSRRPRARARPEGTRRCHWGPQALPGGSAPTGHSSSSQSSVRWPLLCRRMPTSFPAERRLQRELFPELARLVYLLQPPAASSQPGPDGRLLAGSLGSALTSSRASRGGSQPSISSGFLDCMFCFKLRLSQNPDFFSVFSSSLNRKLALRETRWASVGDRGLWGLKKCLLYTQNTPGKTFSDLESNHKSPV